MKLLSITLLLGLILTATPLLANTGVSNKQQAAEIAQQQFPGRVLSVKSKGEKFKVKILNERGDVRIINVKKKAKSR